MVNRIAKGLTLGLAEFAHYAPLFSHNARTYLLSAFLQTAGASIVGCVFALYVKAAGMGVSTIGTIEGVYGIGMAAIALIGPPLVSSRGYRRMMVLNLGLLVAARVGQAFFPIPGTLIALALAVGVGDGFLRTVNSAFLAENSGKAERTGLFSTEFLVRMAAIFFGSLIGGFLPSLLPGTSQQGLEWTITAGALVMSLGMLPLLRLEEEIHGIHRFSKVYTQAVREFKSWNRLGKLILPQAFLVASSGIVAPFVPLYLRHTLGATIPQVGLIQGLGALAMAAVALGAPVMSKKLGPEKSIVVLQCITLPTLAVVPWVGSLVLGVVVLTTRTTAAGVAGPLWNECSMDGVSAHDKPLLAGGLCFVLSIATFFGNLLGGWLMEMSYTTPYLAAAAVWAVGNFFSWYVWVRPLSAEKTAGAVELPHPEYVAAEAA